MSQGPSFRREPYDWVHFVGKQGEPGRCWAAQYHAEPGRSVRAWTRQSLLQLRAGDRVGGKEPLERIAQALASANGTLDPSLRSVLERWYYGARAYYFYCLGGFDSALDDLRLAERAVVTAIDQSPMLLPLAHEAADFTHQRIRIARSRRQWSEMARQIELERAMMADRAPLCTLGDGRRVFYSTLERFHRQLPDLDDGELAYLDQFFDAELRLAFFERSLLSLYLLPGFVVPCP